MPSSSSRPGVKLFSMKAVVQRVKRARVLVDGSGVSEIGPGLLVLLGVAAGDGLAEAAWMARKLAGLRIFSGEEQRMDLSVKDVAGEIMLISQFTLIADTRKGNRPSFSEAAKPELAEPLYLNVAERLGAEKVPVKTGRFGAMMEVELVNDGPVTIILESIR